MDVLGILMYFCLCAEQRPAQYAVRAACFADGKLESMKREGPGLGTQLFASVFGLASVAVGLILLALIFWAVIFY